MIGMVGSAFAPKASPSLSLRLFASCVVQGLGKQRNATMNKAPAFQFYPADFISDELVQTMSNEEIGVYIRMICHDWINGGLPDDHHRLLRLFNCDNACLQACLPAFAIKGGRLFNKRLMKERKKQRAYRQKQSRNAQSRWNQPLNPVPPQCHRNAKSVPTECSSTSSSSSKEKTPIVPKGTGYTDEFERFWSAYPRRVGKRTAFTAFKRANQRADYADIMAGIATSPATTEPDPQFVPHASTWLNRDGWDDEPDEPQIPDCPEMRT